MASLSRVAITKFGRARFGGRFLAWPRLRRSLGCPARAWADHLVVLARELTLLMDAPVVLRHRSVSPFTSRSREATPDLLEPLKRRRFRPPSPHRRVVDPFRRWLIGSAVRPSDGGGLHRSWLRTIVSRRRHGAPAWSTSGIPQHRAWGERFGDSRRRFIQRGGDWRTKPA